MFSEIFTLTILIWKGVILLWTWNFHPLFFDAPAPTYVKQVKDDNEIMKWFPVWWVIQITILLDHNGKILQWYHTQFPSDLMHFMFFGVTQLFIWSWMKNPPLDSSRIFQIIKNQISDVLLTFSRYKSENLPRYVDYHSLFIWKSQCLCFAYSYGIFDLFH